VKGIAHVTGGGIEANLARILPPGLRAVIDRGAWEVPPIFRLIQERGRVPDDEMWRVFNMGIGLVLVAEEGQAAQMLGGLPGCVLMGVVRQGSGSGG